jgi:hypothetical protein
MNKMTDMKRVFLFSAVLLSLTICSPAKAQQAVTQTQKVPCINASKITRGNDITADKSNAWTTETSPQDGVLSLTYCGVFKDGKTTINRLALNQLTEMPAGFESHQRYGELVGEKIRIRNLPAGYTVYKDMAFEIRTEAVPNMMYMTFKIPSVRNMTELKKLRVLYLDEDQLLPGALQWEYYSSELAIPEADFKTRTFSAGFDYTTVFHHATNIGRVVVASFDEDEYNKSRVNLDISSVVGPPIVKVGETFSYSITLVNGGGNLRPATDVVFNSSFGAGEFNLVSASPSQGTCRQSVNSNGVVVCDLGMIDAGKKVVITISVKAEDSTMIDYRGETVFVTTNIVRAREADYTPENNYYESRSTIVRR